MTRGCDVDVRSFPFRREVDWEKREKLHKKSLGRPLHYHLWYLSRYKKVSSASSWKRPMRKVNFMSEWNGPKANQNLRGRLRVGGGGGGEWEQTIKYGSLLLNLFNFISGISDQVKLFSQLSGKFPKRDLAHQSHLLLFPPQHPQHPSLVISQKTLSTPVHQPVLVVFDSHEILPIQFYRWTIICLLFGFLRLSSVLNNRPRGIGKVKRSRQTF